MENTLKWYIRLSGRSQGDFAKRIGVGQPTISNICNGHTQPSLDLALKIVEETDGFVTLESMVVRDREARK